MLKDMAKTGGILFAITFLVALMLAVGNFYTKDPIAMRREEETNAAMQEVLNAAVRFNPTDLEGLAENELFYIGYDAEENPVGFCVTTTDKGYGGDVKVLTALKTDGTVIAVRVLEHSETASVGSKAQSNPELLLDHYKDRTGPFTLSKKPTTDPQGVVAITGATVTSRAVNGAVNRAVSLGEMYLNSQTVAEEGTEE